MKTAKLHTTNLILFYQYIIYYLWPCCNTNVFWAMLNDNESRRMVGNTALVVGMWGWMQHSALYQSRPRGQVQQQQQQLWVISDPRPSNIAHTQTAGIGVRCTGTKWPGTVSDHNGIIATLGRQTTGCPPSVTFAPPLITKFLLCAKDDKADDKDWLRWPAGGHTHDWTRAPSGTVTHERGPYAKLTIGRPEEGAFLDVVLWAHKDAGQ